MRNPFAIPAPGEGRIPDTIVWVGLWLIFIVSICAVWWGLS